MFNTMLRDISKSYTLHVWLKLSRNTAVGSDMCIKIWASLVETRNSNYLAPRRSRSSGRNEQNETNLTFNDMQEQWDFREIWKSSLSRIRGS